jgi:hypothetical protein
VGRENQVMKGHWLRNQRGSVLLFTTVIMVFLLVMGGIAIDLTYHGASKGELQRSMDAAALAGAGNLGFDDTVFPTVRQEAWRFGNLNPYRVGTVNMNLNTANAANGNIVLGIWDGSANTFTPSLDGTQVNAVQCQYATQIPTSFLRLLGFTTLPVGAMAIAVSYPPETIPEEACVFPIGVTDCPFQAGGTYSSEGCGAPLTLISSSGSGGPIRDPGATYTATWLNPYGEDIPNVPLTTNALNAAADGTCETTPLTTGDGVGTNNGMQQVVFDLLEDLFQQKYQASVDSGTSYTVEGVGDWPGYTGNGWQVWIPVLETDPADCPPQALNGVETIDGWTRMVITQVINHGTCAVVNSADVNSAGLCPDSGEPDLRALFGYYDCEVFPAPPNPEPAPRSALADRLRLVQ